MFWSVTHPLFGPATLCDRCALSAINFAAEDRGLRFDSVEEALVIVNALCATYDIPELVVDSAVTGACENCEMKVTA